MNEVRTTTRKKYTVTVQRTQTFSKIFEADSVSEARRFAEEQKDEVMTAPGWVCEDNAVAIEGVEKLKDE